MMGQDLRPVVFADLDDTLFQTARKMSETPDPDRVASVSSNGKHSYMTRAQDQMFSWLTGTTRFIPTTARSQSAMDRCQFVFSDYQILANGGTVLLPGGIRDAEWDAWVSVVSGGAMASLDAIKQAMAPLVGKDGFRTWIVFENSTPIYLCAKSDGPEGVLDEAESRFRDLALNQIHFHRNGRNLGFIPKGITKADAVRAVMDKIPHLAERPVWGMGDSLSDLEFMGCLLYTSDAADDLTRADLSCRLPFT